MKIIVFIVMLLLMQGLAYALVKMLYWLFDVGNDRARKAIAWCVMATGNVLLLLGLLRIPLLFRLTALWLAVLWFAALTGMVVWLCGYLSRRLPALRRRPTLHRKLLRVAAPVLFVGLFAYAVDNAYRPVVRHTRIVVNKSLGGKPLRIAMLADTHLGIMVGARQLDKLAAILASEQPDIILMPGDIMDDNTLAYEAENMQPHLQKLRAPLGVYATLGNHDLFGHEAAISRALQAAGITVLHDEALKVDNRFWVVGRPDNLDKQRLPTAELLKRVDDSQPVFLLDHRPDEILAHAELPIDVQFSGHAHNGQVFPLNWIVRRMYPVHYGYRMINGRHFLVTSGYGFWGIPLRLGSQAEMWIVDVEGR